MRTEKLWLVLINVLPTSAYPVVPSNARQVPSFPDVDQVTPPTNVAVCPPPETSAVVVPVPSSNVHFASRVADTVASVPPASIPPASLPASAPPVETSLRDASIGAAPVSLPPASTGEGSTPASLSGVTTPLSSRACPPPLSCALGAPASWTVPTEPTSSPPPPASNGSAAPSSPLAHPVSAKSARPEKLQRAVFLLMQRACPLRR